MKLVRSNGRRLVVFEIAGAAVYEMNAGAVPLKLHGSFLLSDAQADELICQLEHAQVAAEETEHRNPHGDGG